MSLSLICCSTSITVSASINVISLTTYSTSVWSVSVSVSRSVGDGVSESVSNSAIVIVRSQYQSR